MAQQQRRNRPAFLTVRDPLWGPITQISPEKFEREVTSFVREGNSFASGVTYQYFVGANPAQSGMVNSKGEARANLRLSGREVTVSIRVTSTSGTTRVFELDTFPLPQVKKKLIFLQGFERPGDLYEIYLRPLGRDGNFQYLHAEYWDFDAAGEWGLRPAEADLPVQVIRVTLPELETGRIVTFSLRDDTEVRVKVPVPAKKLTEPTLPKKINYVEKGRQAFRKLVSAQNDASEKT